MANWKPEEFAVGDRVANPHKADWGVGVVVRIWPYDPKSIGQHLNVRFADGRSRTIITSSTPLKRA